MRLIEVIPLTKIPLPQPQVLSYFSGQDLNPGALVLTPLGKRLQEAIVIETHLINDFKMEIKKAGYELKPVGKIISSFPLLTPQQIELALWLRQYYFCSPGLFLKMMLPKSKNLKFQITNSKKIPDFKSQKLILVPTVSMVEKISKNYKSAVFWHSELTKKEQNEIWWKIKNNGVETIIGTRSAVFLPFSGLKEIIIEDATNPSHKSWDMFPHYRTNETAQKLALLFNAKLSLKSEAPFIGVENNTYEVSLRKYSPMKIVDMRQEIKEGNFSIFSQALQRAVKKTLAKKKQAVLFVNRRGSANFVLCRDCGYVAKCKNCEAPLAYHLVSEKPMLLCHRCGFKDIPPSLCPKCQSYRIKTVGSGTQKVQLETQKIFPNAKIIRLDSDIAPLPKEQQKIIETFLKKESDILITTQIIFSWADEIKKAAPITIGLISADTLLHLPDFQSGERIFQTIVRLNNLLADADSDFIIQTYNPKNAALKDAAANDWISFYQQESETRKALGYPPFSQIVKLTFRHQDPKKAGQEAKILAEKLKRANKNAEAQISDALPAFIPREKGKFIWNIILKFPLADGQTKFDSEFLRSRNSLLQYIPSNWKTDVDPSDLL